MTTQATDAAHQCYNRLLAARRVVSDAEWAQIEEESKRERERFRIARRLPKVY